MDEEFEVRHVYCAEFQRPIRPIADILLVLLTSKVSHMSSPR